MTNSNKLALPAPSKGGNRIKAPKQANGLHNNNLSNQNKSKTPILTTKTEGMHLNNSDENVNSFDFNCSKNYPWSASINEVSKKKKNEFKTPDKEKIEEVKFEVDFKNQPESSNQRVLSSTLRTDNNPMLWEEQNSKIEEDGDEEVDKIVKDWEVRDGQQMLTHHSEDPNCDELDFTPDFTDIDKRPNRLRDSRKSAYVKRSVEGRLKDNKFINPFGNFKTDEDFRYQLRGDTQVLYSLTEIGNFVLSKL